MWGLTLRFSRTSFVLGVVGLLRQVVRNRKSLSQRSDVEGLKDLLLHPFCLERLLSQWNRHLNRFIIWNPGGAGWAWVHGRGDFGLQNHGLLFTDALQFQLDLLVLGQEIFEGLVNTVVLLGGTVSPFPELVPHLWLL